MKKQLWIVALILAAALTFASFTAFAEAATPSPYARELKYRRMPTASSDLLEAGIAPILEAQGYTLTPVEITDAIQRETALSEDEIDFHVDAHAAYVDNFNKNQGTDLAWVLPIPTVPAGIYAGAKDDLSQLADGDKIAIPDDASNEARFLYLLENIGWVKMAEGLAPTQYTLLDIAENPLNLEFVSMKGASIAGVRDDFAFVLLRGNDAYNAGIDFNTALASETKDALVPENYWQVIVNGPHKDDGWVQDIIAAYQSEQFKEFMKTQASIWILPDYLTE